MAKRTRASRSAHRPGGQGPTRTKKTSEAETSPATSPEADVGTAEDIGRQLLGGGGRRGRRCRRRRQRDHTGQRRAAPRAVAPAGEHEDEPPRRARADLASRATSEDVWVRADLRRIAVVSVILVAALALAYVVFGIVDVLNLY